MCASAKSSGQVRSSLATPSTAVAKSFPGSIGRILAGRVRVRSRTLAQASHRSPDPLLGAFPGCRRHSWRVCLPWCRLACRRVEGDAVGAEVYVRVLNDPTLGRALRKVRLENRLTTSVAGVKRDAVRHRSVRDTEAHAHRPRPSHVPETVSTDNGIPVQPGELQPTVCDAAIVRTDDPDASSSNRIMRSHSNQLGGSGSGGIRASGAVNRRCARCRSSGGRGDFYEDCGYHPRPEARRFA
jgi:hypothetical protein